MKHFLCEELQKEAISLRPRQWFKSNPPGQWFKSNPPVPNGSKMNFSTKAPKGYIPQTSLGRNAPGYKPPTRYQRGRAAVLNHKKEIGIGAAGLGIGGTAGYALASKREG